MKLPITLFPPTPDYTLTKSHYFLRLVVNLHELNSPALNILQLWSYGSPMHEIKGLVEVIQGLSEFTLKLKVESLLFMYFGQ